MSKRQKKQANDPCTVILSNNGTLELDPDDGTIRYIDEHGNTEGIWTPGDDEYDNYRKFFGP